MSVFVVDASVVVKWFVPEIHSDAARRLLVLPHEYVAPDQEPRDLSDLLAFSSARRLAE